jgi:hypothetical protein
VSSTLGGPLVKLAAFSYGVRRTLSDRRDAEAVKSAKAARKARK